MRALAIERPGHVRVVQRERPQVGPDEVRIRVHAAGICGTDLHILDGEYEATYPRVPGHEFAGEIEAVGSAVTRFHLGDRVSADPNLPCGACERCQRNQQNQCRTLQALGVTRDGAFAEAVVAPASAVVPIGSLPYPVAAFAEPLACVLWGLKRVALSPGATVLVLGAGPMGCLVAQALAASGASLLVVVDPVDRRRRIVRVLGAHQAVAPEELPHVQGDLAPDGFDLVVDATGVASVLASGLAALRPRGTLWVFGVCPPDSEISLRPFDLFRRDLTIIGSFAVQRTLPDAVAMLAGGVIQVEPLLSHSLDLAEGEQAFQVARRDPERMKVQLTP